jgi:hypothetical protein
MLESTEAITPKDAAGSYRRGLWLLGRVFAHTLNILFYIHPPLFLIGVYEDEDEDG